MTFYVHYSIGILAFWVTRNSGLHGALNIIASVSAGVYFPLALLPGWLQKAVLFLPFQFMSYVPVSVFMGEYRLGGIELTILQTVMIQAVATAAMFVLSKVLWHFGSKRNMGVGV
jgi:ABC-2 type transport system permease protein